MLVVESPPANAGDIRDPGSIPESGRSPGGGQGNSLQDSCWENPEDRVPGVAKSWTQLKWLSSAQHWVSVMACRIFHCSMWDLDPWPGIKPESPALGVQNLSHWTTREVPCRCALLNSTKVHSQIDYWHFKVENSTWTFHFLASCGKEKEVEPWFSLLRDNDSWFWIGAVPFG